MSTGNPVVDAILAGTSNAEVREAMLLGSHLESGWNTNAVGDQGTSFGAFQMHIGGALTAAGGTPADAENPTWAVQHMLGSYTSAVNQVSPSLWQSNPEQAAEQAAVIAEAPAQTYYASQGTAAVDSAWNAVENALKGIVSSSGSPGGSQSATLTSAPFPGGVFDPLNFPFEIGGGAVGNVVGDIGSGLTSAFVGLFEKMLQSLGIPSFKDLLIRIGLIGLGLIIVILGLREFIRSGGYVPETTSAVGKAANVAEFVAK